MKSSVQIIYYKVFNMWQGLIIDVFVREKKDSK